MTFFKVLFYESQHMEECKGIFQLDYVWNLHMEVFKLFQTFREKRTTQGSWLGWDFYMQKPELRKMNKLLAFLSKVYEGETLGMAMECCIVVKCQEKDAWKTITKIIQLVHAISMAGFVPEGTQMHILDESLSKSMTAFLAVSPVEVLVYAYTK